MATFKKRIGPILQYHIDSAHAYSLKLSLFAPYILTYQTNFHRYSRRSLDPGETLAWDPFLAARGRIGGPTSECLCFGHRCDSMVGHSDYMSRDSHWGFGLRLSVTGVTHLCFCKCLCSRRLIIILIIFWKPLGHRSSSPCLPARVRHSWSKRHRILLCHYDYPFNLIYIILIKFID